MSFEIVQSSAEFVSCRATGPIDYDVFVVLFRDLARQYDGRLKGVRLRCDVSAGNPGMDFGDEVRLVDYLSRNHTLFDGSKWAFIADSPQMVELGKIGKILVMATDLNVEMDVFDSPDQAEAWLGRAKTQREVDAFVR